LYGVPPELQNDLFEAYSDFLDILDTSEMRRALEDLRAADSRDSVIFRRVRQISERFEKGLDNLFFENEKIRPLTRKYGLF
jgi:hypothetical protein